MARNHRVWGLLALFAGVLGVAFSAVFSGALATPSATGATPAAVSTEPPFGTAASALFGCRASTARVSVAGQTLVEPGVANNPTNPCNTQSVLAPQVQLAGSNSPLNLGTVGPAASETYETGTLGGTPAPGATAISDIQALNLTAGGYTLTAAGPIEAQAAIACNGTTAQMSGSSTLNVITITGPGLPAGGVTLNLANVGHNALVNQLSSALAPLDPVLEIDANVETSTATSLTERLLEVKVLGAAGANPVADVVVGEAIVNDKDANVCDNNGPNPPNTVTTPGTTTTITGANGTTTVVTTPGGTTTTGGGTTVLPGGTVPGYLQACAPGSQLDPATGNCVIFLPGGKTIYVSAPFKGPSGGTVIPLSTAESKYRSACFSGSGPNWVLVVSTPGIHAKGTPNSDRILGIARNVWVNGLAGNDCIDLQGGGTEHADDANGNDRIYTLKGSARIVIGNGHDYINAEHTTGWITAGNGFDRVYGGTGKYRIDLGRGTKHVKTFAAYARIYTPGGHGQIACGNKNDTLWVLKAVAHYSWKHGCLQQKTHFLR